MCVVCAFQITHTHTQQVEFEMNGKPAEGLLFEALLKVQEQYAVPIDQLQNSIKASYRMLIEYNKVHYYYAVLVQCNNLFSSHNQLVPLPF